MNAHIAGTGHFLPPDRLTNDDLSRMVDTSDEWIVSHTGIRVRHIARDLSAVDMGEKAAQAALENAGLSPDDIDMVVVSTVTPDRRFPSVSCDLQQRMGMSQALCFDINVSCTGFVYAIDIASRYLMTGGAKNALIVSVEKLSAITDYTDRKTCILFGDGAGAVVLTAAETPGGLLASYMASRGDGGAALRGCWDGYLEMDGPEVFKFAVRAVPDAIEKVLAQAGRDVSELSFIIPHQANMRIIDSVVRRYNLPPEKVIVTVDRHGNTSSASIPLALDELNRAGRIKSGDLLLMVGFGGGLTYGATLFEINANLKTDTDV